MAFVLLIILIFKAYGLCYIYGMNLKNNGAV